MKHKKPTVEELETDLKKTQEDLEVDKKEEEKEVEDIKEKVEDVVVEPEKEEKEEIVEEEPEKEKEEEKVEEKEPDYKEKFSQSSREAQKIHAKNRTLNEGISKASEINEVTDDEVQKEYTDWDVMSETERRLAKDNLLNKKRFAIVNKATEEAKRIEKWEEDVNTFIEDPKTLNDHPSLEGKQSEFVNFANELPNHAVPFKVLVSAFLHDMSTKVKPKSKGKMFEVGSGGPNSKMKPKSDKISIDDARILMKTDYKKYKEYLVSGKIDMNAIE